MCFKKGVFYSLLAFFILYLPNIVQAEQMPYSIKGESPSNQLDKSKSYFDLLMKPGAEQDLKVILSNSSDEEIAIHVEPNIATTNGNGLIEYNTSKTIDSSLKYPLTTLISEKQRIIVPAKSEKEAIFHVRMPNKEINGIILGAFYCYKEDSPTEKKTGNNVQIKNKFAYILGVQLRQNQNVVKENLNLLDVKPSLLNYRTAILATIQNDQAALAKNVAIEAKIFKKKNNKLQYHTEKNGFSIAPNSHFDFPVMLENQPLKPGKYVLKIKMINENGSWAHEKEFEINKEEAAKLNEKAVDLEKEPFNFVWLIIGLLLLLVLLLSFMLLKSKQTNISN